MQPLKAFRHFDSQEVKILNRWTVADLEKRGALVPVYEGERVRYLNPGGDGEYFDVPCGRCINCRLDYAKKWSQRCLLEAKCWSENFFLTLTYDDEHLPLSNELGLSSLESDHVKNFLKRLREYYERNYHHVGIRFYLAAEYGDQSMRPHYHLIAFNLPIFDLRYYSKSDLGDVYFNSDIISRLWGFGHVVIGEVTAQSAAYTARYCQKKAYKDIDYQELGISKEFVRMSRRPGIGMPYLEAHARDIYKNDVIYLPGGQLATPCRFFDDRAEQFGIDIEQVKEKRRLASALTTQFNLEQVSVPFWKYMNDLEQSMVKRSKILRRNL